MRAILGCVAVLALACGATTLAGQAKLDAKKLVGKWEPAPEKIDKKNKKDKNEDKTPPAPPPIPTIIEFSADGKLSMTVGEPGKDYRVDGTYKLDSDKLSVSLKVADKEIKETLTIKKLTDDELVTEDSKNKIEALRRKR